MWGLVGGGLAILMVLRILSFLNCDVFLAF